MTPKLHSASRNYYTPSIRFFQRDSLDYLERMEGEKKITLIVDKSQLSEKEQSLYNCFRLTCLEHNIDEMRVRKRKDYAERAVRMQAIVELASSLNQRIGALEIDQAHINYAFAQEERRLRRQLLRQQPMPEGIPRLLSSDAEVYKLIQLTDASMSRGKKLVASRQAPVEALFSNKRERALASIKQKKLLPKETSTQALSPSLLEKFLGFFLTCLNKMKNFV